MRTRICTICARGGSKGVKGKNIRLFAGKPLIAHVIEIAKRTNLFQVLAVSSDSAEILEIAAKYGVEHLIERPALMAIDAAPKLPAIKHCVFEVQKKLGIIFDTMVDLSVTSPLMLPQDIEGAIKLLEESDAFNVITAAKAAHSPYFSVVEKSEGEYVQLVKKTEVAFARRQDCPDCYEMNGAVYVWSGEHFFNMEEVITERTLVYEMPKERSIDIDAEIDFELAQFLHDRKLNSTVRNEIVPLEV